MTTATTVNPMLQAFVQKLNKVYGSNQVSYQEGRKYDKVFDSSGHRFFVNRGTWDIFGAKSDAQVNFRRWYGRLNTIEDWDWVLLTPLAGTVSETLLREREAKIMATYKQRGRPKKQQIPVDQTLPIL